MDISSFFVLLLLGCAAGFAAGYFSFDTGIVLVPALLVWYKSSHVSFLVSPHLAIGTVLIVGALVAAEAAYADHPAGFVLWRQVIPMAGGGIAGAVLGALLAGSFTAETLTRLFAAAAVFAALQLFGTRRKPKDAGAVPELATVKLTAFGVVAGLIGALTTAGNKLVAQPALYKQLRVPLKRSTGTANAASALFFLAGGIAFLVVGRGNVLLPSPTFGYVDLWGLLPLSLGAVVCSHPGKKLQESHPMRNASLVCGIILLGIAIKLLVAP